jgi:Skp family chaperone for outer membrane proteins
MRGGRAILAALALSAGPALPAAAQEVPQLALGQVQSVVLTIDIDRLFAETQFGRRVAAELRVASEALAAENRRIEAELVAEERSLTERRPMMPVEDFRAAAQAFDEKVQRIRAEQDAKERALQTRLDQGRQAFLNAATPVLGRMMRDAGAVVILDRRTVFLSIGAVDITDEAVLAIDAAIGDGSSAEGEEAPAPDTPTTDTPAPGTAAPPPGGGQARPEGTATPSGP